MKKLLIILVIILSVSFFLLPLTSVAQWWKFGKRKNAPEIVRLYLGKIDARDIDEQVTITPSDMEHGVLYIKGKARVREGRIAKIKISYDGGKTWVDVKVKEGNFLYKFTPTIGSNYDFQIYAIDTTGRKSDPHDYEFKIYVRPEISKDAVRQAFEKMLQAYMRENLNGFMRYVSDNFEGDISVLEDALEKDFRYFDNIRIYVSISRITKRGKYYDVCFRYNRRVTSTKTGSVLKDNSTSCASFELKDNQIKLVKLMAPLIFGVSEPADVATAVNQEAVGTQVLRVDQEGNVEKTKQGEKVETAETPKAPEEISYESECVDPSKQEGYDFDNKSKVVGWGVPGMDILFQGNIIFFFGSAPHGIIKMPQADLDDIGSCPTTGYQGEALNIMPGDIYCVWTNGGTYVKMKVTAVGANDSCFDFAVSKNNNF